MSANHLSASDLELYVIDGLDALRAARVEAHVFECEACSMALAREASLELALEEVARAPVTRDVPRPMARPVASTHAHAPARRRVSFALATAGTLSLAAAWLLWLSPATHSHPRSPSSDGYESVAGAGAGAGAAHDMAAGDAAISRLDAMAMRDALDGG